MYLTDFNLPEKSVPMIDDLYADPRYSGYLEIMFALVQSYAKNDQNDDAINILQDWLAKNPDDQEAQSMLNILKGDAS